MLHKGYQPLVIKHHFEGTHKCLKRRNDLNFVEKTSSVVGAGNYFMQV